MQAEGMRPFKNEVYHVVGLSGRLWLAGNGKEIDVIWGSISHSYHFKSVGAITGMTSRGQAVPFTDLLYIY